MARGGVRAGAGRPTGTGKFGESTHVMRVPKSQVDHVRKLIANKCYRFPLYQSAVSAGFPCPAESEMEGEFDLNELLIRHPAATFFVRVSGSSMEGAGIHHSDILVVDRSLEPVDGKIVIAAIDGEIIVKRLCKEGKKVFLNAENEEYAPIEVLQGQEIHIWGVVTNVIHAV